MKCNGCGSENPASSRFCAICGLRLSELERCEACGRKLPEGAQFCPDCGLRVDPAPMVTPSETFERHFYRQTRYAFYHRFVERIEKKSSQVSLYGVTRLLSKRSIELDMAGSLSDVAIVVGESAHPFVTSLRQREIYSELTAFLATISDEFWSTLSQLDHLGRLAATDLTDLRFGSANSPLEQISVPSLQRIWTGIGVSFGTAVEPSHIVGEVSAETAIVLQELNHAFFKFVAAYDRLWLPFFDFIERYMAKKCHLLWQLLATYSHDFRRYSALLLEAKANANEDLLPEALAAIHKAHLIKPHEYQPPLLQGYLLYRLGRYEEAVQVLKNIEVESLPFVSLTIEKHFWTGRCLFELGRLEEAIAPFEAVVSQPKEQIQLRYLREAQYLLALTYLMVHEFEKGSQCLSDALRDGYTEVEGMITDPRLSGARDNLIFRTALRSVPFLQALGRHAGAHLGGSTYLSRSAAPVKLAISQDGWLQFEEGEDLVFFFDASRTGSGHHGLCLTDRRLVWRERNKVPRQLALENLHSTELAAEGLLLNSDFVISDQVFESLESLHLLLSQLRNIFRE